MEDQMSGVTIRYPDSDLYHRYDGQTGPQRTFLAFDPERRILSVAWDPEIGGSVYHGRRIRRYPLPSPLLSHAAILALMDQVAPLAARVADGYKKEALDGQARTVGRLDDDACEAEASIEDALRECDTTECVPVWDAAEWYAASRSEVVAHYRAHGEQATAAWLREQYSADNPGGHLEGVDALLRSVAEETADGAMDL